MSREIKNLQEVRTSLLFAVGHLCEAYAPDRLVAVFDDEAVVSVQTESRDEFIDRALDEFLSGTAGTFEEAIGD